MTDGCHQRTLFRVAGQKGGTSLSSLKKTFPGIDAQIGELLTRSMAGVALLGQQRADLFFEKFNRLPLFRLRRGGPGVRHPPQDGHPEKDSQRGEKNPKNASL